MEPLDKDELSDRDLDDLLKVWKSPKPPARLRAAVFPEPPRPWWRNLWGASIRLPVPLVCGLTLVLALAGWQWSARIAPRVVIKTERVEVPVVKEQVVYRDRIVHAPASTQGPDANRLQPVAELRPRIIRRTDAQN